MEKAEIPLSLKEEKKREREGVDPDADQRVKKVKTEEQLHSPTNVTKKRKLEEEQEENFIPTQISKIESKTLLFTGPIDVSPQLHKKLELKNPSLLPKSMHTDIKKRELTEILSHWEQVCLSSSFFEADVEKLITWSYPNESKSSLDSVLSTFLLLHPEHTQTILYPIIQLIQRGSIKYNKRIPPFYAFFNIFTNSESRTELKAIQKAILQFLSKHNKKWKELTSSSASTNEKERERYSLSLWIADLLVEAPLDIIEWYFSDLLRSTNEHSFVKTEATNAPEMILSFVQEERGKMKHKSMLLVETAVPLVVHSTLPLEPFKELFKIYFSQPPNGNSIKLVHEMFSLAETRIMEIVQLLYVAMATTHWFHSHFLVPLIEEIGEKTPQAEQLFVKIASDAKLSALLFGHLVHHHDILITREKQTTSLPKKKTPKFEQNIMDVLLHTNKETTERVMKILGKVWSSDLMDSVLPFDRLHSLMLMYPNLSEEIQTEIVNTFTYFLKTKLKKFHESSTAQILRDIVRYFFLENSSEKSEKLFMCFMESVAALQSSEPHKAAELTSLIKAYVRSLPLHDVTTHSNQHLIEDEGSVSEKVQVLMKMLVGMLHSEIIGNFIENSLLCDMECLKALMLLIDSKDPDIRHHSIKLLSHVNTCHISGFWNRGRLNGVLRVAGEDTVAHVADAALQLVLKLSETEEYSKNILDISFSLLMSSRQDEGNRMVDVLVHLLSKFRHLLPVLEDKIKTHLYAGVETFTNSPRISFPNQHLLLLITQLIQRQFTLRKELIALALEHTAVNPEHIKLEQLKLLAASSNSVDYKDILQQHIAEVLEGIASSSKSIRELCILLVERYLYLQSDGKSQQRKESIVQLVLFKLKNSLLTADNNFHYFHQLLNQTLTTLE